jgi:hypothetical protein
MLRVRRVDVRAVDDVAARVEVPVDDPARLRGAAPEAARDLHDAVATLLIRAQRAGCVRPEIDADDVVALVAGTFAAIRHAGAEAAPHCATRLTTVLFDGLRATRRSVLVTRSG